MRVAPFGQSARRCFPIDPIGANASSNPPPARPAEAHRAHVTLDVASSLERRRLRDEYQTTAAAATISSQGSVPRRRQATTMATIDSRAIGHEFPQPTP